MSAKKHPGGVTAKQEWAIGALLSQPSVKQAAEATPISYATLRRWLAHDERFREAYRDARRAVVEQATARLQSAAAQAVSVLLAVALNPDAHEPARVGAARTILEFAYRGMEADDLANRIENLERLAAAVNEPITITVEPVKGNQSMPHTGKIDGEGH